MTRAEIEELKAGPEADRLIAIIVIGEPKPVALKGAEAAWAISRCFEGETVKSEHGGWHVERHYDEGDDPVWAPNPFSTEMDSAMLVIEKIKDVVTLNRRGEPSGVDISFHTGRWYVVLEAWEDGPHDSVSAKTLPLAICRAALIVARR